MKIIIKSIFLRKFHWTAMLDKFTFNIIYIICFIIFQINQIIVLILLILVKILFNLNSVFFICEIIDWLPFDWFILVLLDIWVLHYRHYFWWSSYNIVLGKPVLILINAPIQVCIQKFLFNEFGIIYIHLRYQIFWGRWHYFVERIRIIC